VDAQIVGPELSTIENYIHIYMRRWQSFLQGKRYNKKIIAMLRVPKIFFHFVLSELRLLKVKLMFSSQFAASSGSASCFYFHCPFIAKFTCVQTWLAKIQIKFFVKIPEKVLKETRSSADFTHSSKHNSCIFFVFSVQGKYTYTTTAYFDSSMDTCDIIGLPVYIPGFSSRIIALISTSFSISLLVMTLSLASLNINVGHGFHARKALLWKELLQGAATCTSL
jgi:hypothetical protein